MEKREYKIEGMYCPACVNHVMKASNKTRGVSKSEVSLLSNSLTIYFEQPFDEKELLHNLAIKGYKGTSLVDATYEKRRELRKKELKHFFLRLLISAILLIPLMYFSMGPMLGWPSIHPLYINYAISLALCLIIIFLNGRFFYRGLVALFTFHPSMESLVSIGSLTSLIYSLYGFIMLIIATFNNDASLIHSYSMIISFEASAMVPFFVSLGDYLETMAKDKTTSSLESLGSLVPSTAFKVVNEELKEVDSSSLEIKDIVFLKAGSRIPSDGKVIEGHANISEAALFGEAKPIFKQENDIVYAGSFVISGSLKYEVSKKANASFISDIIASLEKAGEGKTKLTSYTDKIAKYFTPAILILALVTYLSWLLSGHEQSLAINMGINILVVSCPCALGLASPLATTIGLKRALNEGLLIKDSSTFSSLSKIDTLVFDKTGTLSESYMQVSEEHLDTSEDKVALLSLEKLSSHPLAEATCLYLEKEGNVASSITNFLEVPGSGVSGIYMGSTYYAGNLSYLESKGIKDLPTINEDGSSYIYLGKGKEYKGYLMLESTLKADAKATIKELLDSGFNLVLASGDNPESVKKVALETGIVTYYGGLKPLDKAVLIDQLKEDKHHVAMIGDGINDALALKKADVGIALASGSDLALDSSSIILLNSSLKSVTSSIALSKKVNANIIENLFFSFVYNIVSLPLAAGALYYVNGFIISPMIASALMAASSLSIVLNALRLFLKGGKKHANND
jgi:heavy metal translocating P-type ATPase